MTDAPADPARRRTTPPSPSSATPGDGGGEGGAPARRPAWAQLGRFATIGVASTVLNLGLFALMRGPMGDQVANLLSLVIATVFNTAANRWWTFEVRGRDGMGRHQAQGLAVFALTWALTSGALALLGLAWPTAPTLVRVAAVAAANVVATVVRYVAMKRWIFRHAAT